MNRQRKNDQYTEGFDAGAAYACEGIIDNPYNPDKDSNRYEGWEAGWDFYMNDESDNQDEE
jgi:hypothetical protein